MNGSNEREVKLNKAKMIKGVLAMLGIGICGVVVVLGMVIVLVAEKNATSFTRILFLILFLFSLTTMCFGFVSAVGLLMKLFRMKPALVLTGTGLVYSLSNASMGFVPWSEVIDVEVLEFCIKGHDAKMLVVKVKSPQHYAKLGNLRERANNWINYKTCGSPIVLSTDMLKISVSDLMSLFAQYREKAA